MMAVIPIAAPGQKKNSRRGRLYGFRWQKRAVKSGLIPRAFAFGFECVSDAYLGLIGFVAVYLRFVCLSGRVGVGVDPGFVRRDSQMGNGLDDFIIKGGLA